MKKRSLLTAIIGVSVVLFTLAGLAIVGIRQAMNDALRRSTDDAVQVIAGNVLQLYESGRSPTPSEVDQAIKSLINASVISTSFAPGGKPADSYGTPLRVTHAADGHRHFVTVSSAGADLVFDTSDDISSTAISEERTPQK